MWVQVCEDLAPLTHASPPLESRPNGRGASLAEESFCRVERKADFRTFNAILDACQGSLPPITTRTHPHSPYTSHTPHPTQPPPAPPTHLLQPWTRTSGKLWCGVLPYIFGFLLIVFLEKRHLRRKRSEMKPVMSGFQVMKTKK